VTLPAGGPPVEADLLTTIAAACRDHQRLRFDYRTHDGDLRPRDTEPHRLVSAGRRWYLVAWDADRRDWRTFRVDRMRIRGPAGPPFAPRPLTEAEVADRVTRGLATATWRYQARVTVAAPAGRIRSRLPAGISVEPVDEDTCVAVLGADSPHWLALYLGLMDADFRIDPAAAPELAGHLRTLAGRYARAAG